MIWKLKGIVNDEYLRATYFGFFQSHIAYGLMVWGHSSYVHKILILQKKVVRTICGASPLEHCRPLFIKLRVMTVISLYIYHVLLYTKSNLSDYNSRIDIHCYNTRGKLKLDIPLHRLSKSANSHRINCIRFFNKLPLNARFVTFNRFKIQLNNWLIMNPFYDIKEFLAADISIDF